MGNPTKAQLHTDRPLTNISVAYQQKDEDYVATKVFPIVTTLKQSNQYYVYDIGDSYRSEAAKRAPGTKSKRTGWRTSKGTYFADKWSVGQDIPDEDRDNADEPLDLDRDATRHITQDMLIAKETEWATAFFTTSVWTGSTTATDITPGSLWDTVASTPIEDVRAQATSIKKKTGFRPNTFVLGIDTFDALVDHPDILDRIKYTQKGVVTMDLLAQVFNVDKVMVAEAIKNSGAEEATDSLGFIVGSNDALLTHSASSPGIRVFTGGYTFAWRVQGNNGVATRIRKFRSEETESDVVEINAYWDYKVIDANGGVFFSNTVS